MREPDRHEASTAILLMVSTILGMVFVASSCQPKPTPTPPPPGPPPACECYAPGPEDPGWSGASVEVPYNESIVGKTRDIVGDRCGTDGNETLALLAKALVAQNVCAVGPWADAILVSRPDGKWEEWHAIEWSNTGVAGVKAGCWYPLSKAYKGAWQNASAKGCVK